MCWYPCLFMALMITTVIATSGWTIIPTTPQGPPPVRAVANSFLSQHLQRGARMLKTRHGDSLCWMTGIWVLNVCTNRSSIIPQKVSLLKVTFFYCGFLSWYRLRWNWNYIFVLPLVTGTKVLVISIKYPIIIWFLE